MSYVDFIAADRFAKHARRHGVVKNLGFDLASLLFPLKDGFDIEQAESSGGMPIVFDAIRIAQLPAKHLVSATNSDDPNALRLQFKNPFR